MSSRPAEDFDQGVDAGRADASAPDQAGGWNEEPEARRGPATRWAGAAGRCLERARRQAEAQHRGVLLADQQPLGVLGEAETGRQLKDQFRHLRLRADEAIGEAPAILFARKGPAMQHAMASAIAIVFGREQERGVPGLDQPGLRLV